MNNFLRKISLFITVFSMVLVLAACDKSDEKIVIGEGKWDSVMFHDQVAKFIIENGYDIEVDIVPADTAVLVQSLKSGDVDLTTELWTDNIASYKEDVENGEYKSISTNFDDNTQGLYVPTYLVEGPDALAPNLKTVQDLADYTHLFEDPEGGDKAIIYGGPESWAATEFIHKKLEAYELDDLYKFKTINSNATLSTTLVDAYENEEPWVGYNWEPTWIMGKYDMTLLEDSEYSEDDYENGVGAFPTVDVDIVVTDGFEERFPEIYAFLSQYKTSSEITSSALAYMQENEVDADVAAKWFLENNKDLWSAWLPEDVVEKVSSALDE